MERTRRCGKLTIRVVHRLHSFDNIFVLGRDGAIVERGSFKSLKSYQDYISSILSVSEAVESQEEKILDVLISPEKVASTEEPKDSHHQTGDWIVYKYSLKSTRWPNAAFALSMSIANGICVVYSSKYSCGLFLRHSLITYSNMASAMGLE
jgi:hypothetical protein